MSPDQANEQGPARRPSSFNFKVLLALCLVHFIGDFFTSFFYPLIPEFISRFSLTLAQVGFITGMSRILSFVVQPCVGYLADHYRTRFFVLGGPLLTIFFISMTGIAPTYSALIALVCIGSIGASMYHPTAAGMVSTFSGPHIGFSMSIFNMGGTMAFGLGPLMITFLVEKWGLSATPFAMIIGLLVMFYPFKVLPYPEEEGLKALGFLGSMKEVLGKVWKPIALIWVISVIRSLVSQAFSTFLPVLCSREGMPLFSIGLIVSLFSIAGAISGVVAGHLSDRIGYKPIFYTSSILSAVFLYLLIVLPGQWILVNAFFSGFFIMAVLPLTVTMGQELAPKGRSIVSSLMMGLAFGTGGMLTPVVGHFADLYSIKPVLGAIGFLPVITIPLIYFLPDKKQILTRTVCAP